MIKLTGGAVSTANGQVSITVTAVPGTVFIIGVKYDSNSIKGTPPPAGDVHYTFVTKFGADVVPGTTDGLTLKKK